MFSEAVGAEAAGLGKAAGGRGKAWALGAGGLFLSEFRPKASGCNHSMNKVEAIRAAAMAMDSLACWRNQPGDLASDCKLARKFFRLFAPCC